MPRVPLVSRSSCDPCRDGVGLCPHGKQTPTSAAFCRPLPTWQRQGDTDRMSRCGERPGRSTVSTSPTRGAKQMLDWEGDASVRNPYLTENFRPVNSEYTVTDLPVSGHIPEALDGRYVRNGPNPISADPGTYHWFLGDGMLHGVRLRDGRAEWYRNRWVRSADVADALGEPRQPGPVHAGLDYAANTSVIQHAGRTLALVEAGPRPYELTEDLETVGPFDFFGTLKGGFTAHPKRDPDTGELHAIAYYWGDAGTVRYLVVGLDGRIRRSTEIDVGGSPLIHDFALTAEHVIVFDLPVTFDASAVSEVAPRWLRRPVERSLAAVVGRHRVPDFLGAVVARKGKALFPYRWDPSRLPRVGVISRLSPSRDPQWLPVSPCFVFHVLNAYDDGDDVVVDLVRHPKAFDVNRRGPNEGPPALERWALDLRRGAVTEERLDDRGQEFPRADERMTGRPHRYGYAVEHRSLEGSLRPTNTLIKHDLLARNAQYREFPDSVLDEFVFVPRSDDGDEDDGVLMGYVYNQELATSDLALLDAQTLETVATVHLPIRVPHGFHGNWLVDGGFNHNATRR